MQFVKILLQTILAATRAAFMLHRNKARRIYLKDVIYFITARCIGDLPYFKDEAAARILVNSFFINRKLKNFQSYIMVVMPDHFHCLIKPRHANISEIMRSIKTNSSREINRYYDVRRRSGNRRRSGATSPMHVFPPTVFRWQKGFHDHIIRNDKDFHIHYRYIFLNPVRAGLVRKSYQYPWLYTNP